ncbi:MAG: phosphoribosylamine--glycine ligase [Schleiferiaceae bacterium]|nr:phosphoribosylamine--glycine ligase [Schleiferiaceae bacterium]
MNVLILGSGGREHALAFQIAKSPLLSQLYIAPGNGGTQQLGENLSVSPTDFSALKQTIIEKSITLVVVGPEDPLVAGIVDYIKSDADLDGVMVIGPAAAAAQLEGSKDFAKAFMSKYQIPTAAYQTFSIDNQQEAFEFLKTLTPPYVLKADGLAAGKGVVILEDYDAACAELAQMFSGKFGKAGAKVVIEEFLDGIEYSMFAFVNQEDYVIFPAAKDYKRIGEGDTGLNTGGMGAVSPVSFLDDILLERSVKEVIAPTVAGIQSEGFDYCGFVFFGLINVKGAPKVIEYNVRLGDPETEVILPRVQSDLLEFFIKAAQNDLRDYTLQVDPRTAATVMVVSEGYPEAYEKGKTISGLHQDLPAIPFHAGTKVDANGKLVTAGGRVMAFTGFGDDLDAALKNAYDAVNKVCYEGITYRSDIGQDLK